MTNIAVENQHAAISWEFMENPNLDTVTDKPLHDTYN